MRSSRSTAGSATRGGPAVLVAGAGAREVLAAGGVGEVLAWFPRAAYLRLQGRVLVIVSPDVHLGPLYLRLQGRLPRLPVGAPAAADPSAVEAGPWRFPVDGGTWWGTVPSPGRLRAAAGTLKAALAEASQGSRLEADARAAAEEALLIDDLQAAARALEGRGRGLTPSGDDVMAGVLFGARTVRGRASEGSLVAVARSLATGGIARAFALWAARGQALAPAHRLLVAAASDDPRRAGRAARSLAAVGESSGADFCLGMRLAFDLLPDR